MKRLELASSLRFRSPLAIFITVYLVFFPYLVGVGKDLVSPGKERLMMRPGGHDHVNIDIVLPRVATPVDVVLAIDCTISMEDILKTIQARAVEVVETLRAYLPEVAYAIACVRDYDNAKTKGNPLELIADISEDHNLAIDALKRIELRDGSDFPEAYVRGLYELQFVSWRSNAKRVVILFADAPLKNPDPGRDALLGTADDLNLHDVVSGLAARGIAVNPIYSLHQGEGDAVFFRLSVDEWNRVRESFEVMAAKTGGKARPVGEASGVSDEIIYSVLSQFGILSEIALPKKFEEWVTISGPHIEKPDQLRVAVAIHPPTTTTLGWYDIPLQVFQQANPPRPLGQSLLKVLIIPRWVLAGFTICTLALVVIGLLRRMFYRTLPVPQRLEQNRQGLVACWKFFKLMMVIMTVYVWIVI